MKKIFFLTIITLFMSSASALADDSCKPVFSDLLEWSLRNPGSPSNNFVQVEMTTMKVEGAYTGYSSGKLDEIGAPYLLQGELNTIYSTRNYVGTDGLSHPFSPTSLDYATITLSSKTGKFIYFLKKFDGTSATYTIDPHCANGFIYGFGDFANGRHLISISYSKRHEVVPV